MIFGDPICQNEANTCYCYVLRLLPHRLTDLVDLVYLNWFWQDHYSLAISSYTTVKSHTFDPKGVPRLIVSIPQQTLFFPKFSVTFDGDFNDMDIKPYNSSPCVHK